MPDIVVSLTKKGRELEAQQLLYGYAFKVDYFEVGSGGHDPGNPTIALPLDQEVTVLPGSYFGPEPVDEGILISSTCPRWTCILQPGEAVGGMSNFGLVATVLFVPSASILITAADINAGSSDMNFLPTDVSTGSETITIPAHGFSDGDAVVFATSDTLPGGLFDNVNYYIVNSTLSTFQVSTVVAGPAVDLTSQGIGTHTIRLASDDVITKSSHGFVDGNIVNMITTGVMPGGLISAQSYYVINATPSTFKVSNTLGGAPVNIISSGSGVHTVTNLSSLPPGSPVVGSTFLYAQTNFPLKTKFASERITLNVTLQT